MAHKSTFAVSRMFILAPILLLALFGSHSSAATVCDASVYGNPYPPNCTLLLHGNSTRKIFGLESIDQDQHLFYTADINKRPSDVTVAQWRNKEFLYGVIGRDGCSVFLALGYNTNGAAQYDTGTYSSIVNQATKVQNYCSHFPDSQTDQASSMQGGQSWIGDRGHILAMIFSDTSAFATTLSERQQKGLQADLWAISQNNPLITATPEPVCKRSPYCSKTSHCRGTFGCTCVADKWHGEFYSSTCIWPFPVVPRFRGLAAIDSANTSTQLPLSTNTTLTAEISTDLACPCNCTYVSKACCDSALGIVYEAPDLRLGSLLAPSANLTCNATTGDFQASNITLDVTLTPRE